MRQLLMFGLSFVMMIGSVACDAQAGKSQATSSSGKNKVEVYYFHFTRRCHTCQSVEAGAKQAVETLYPDKVKSGQYTFKALNLDDESSKATAEKLGVGGQTLLVVCGNNKVDITDKGFMNANNPDRMKEEVKKAVDNVIEK